MEEEFNLFVMLTLKLNIENQKFRPDVQRGSFKLVFILWNSMKIKENLKKKIKKKFFFYTSGSNEIQRSDNK